MQENSDIGGFGQPTVIADGPFAGWLTWGEGSDPFETLCGPLCFKVEDDGRVRIAFQPEQKHLNGGGMIHGGMLMTFADFSCFAIAEAALRGTPAVTVTFNCELVGPGKLGAMIEAEGRVIRQTASMVFVQGQLTQEGAAIVAFSATLKKLKRR